MIDNILLTKNNQTEFELISKAIKKQRSIKCLVDGVNHIETLIDKRNDLYENHFLKSIELNNRIDDLINDFKFSKNIDKGKLKLINDYFKNKNITADKSLIPLPLSYEIKTNHIKNDNLYRYLLSAFLLTFWMTYFILSDFKKLLND